MEQAEARGSQCSSVVWGGVCTLPSYSLGLGSQGLCGMALDWPQFGALCPSWKQYTCLAQVLSGPSQTSEGTWDTAFPPSGLAFASGIETQSFLDPGFPLLGCEMILMDGSVCGLL